MFQLGPSTHTSAAMDTFCPSTKLDAFDAELSFTDQRSTFIFRLQNLAAEEIATFSALPSSVLVKLVTDESGEAETCTAIRQQDN